MNVWSFYFVRYKVLKILSMEDPKKSLPTFGTLGTTVDVELHYEVSYEDTVKSVEYLKSVEVGVEIEARLEDSMVLES